MNTKEYIESGILEAYILGELHAGVNETPIEIAAKFHEVKQELLEIKEALERYALSHSVMPSSTLKPLLLATIDYFDSMNGEDEQAMPSILTRASSIADFSPLVERRDWIAPADFTGIYAKIIGYTAKVTTALVWMKDVIPTEFIIMNMKKF